VVIHAQTHSHILLHTCSHNARACVAYVVCFHTHTYSHGLWCSVLVSWSSRFLNIHTFIHSRSYTSPPCFWLCRAVVCLCLCVVFTFNGFMFRVLRQFTSCSCTHHSLSHFVVYVGVCLLYPYVALPYLYVLTLPHTSLCCIRVRNSLRFFVPIDSVGVACLFSGRASS
jgi:hypothetical protein